VQDLVGAAHERLAGSRHLLVEDEVDRVPEDPEEPGD
jgi:hypothetical protein